MEAHRRLRTSLLMTVTLALAVVVGTAATASAADNDRGTIKIHDDPTADPEERNEPHVSCDFYVQGFNMKDPEGHLVFRSWPPTGNKSVVTPSGDSLTWTGTSDGDGEYDFSKGAYQLPEGHYRLEAFTDDGHPGHDGGHFAKAKMFWVDPCGGTPPTQPPTSPTPPEECDDSATEIDECVTEIPFFPSVVSMALAGLGTAGVVGAFALRRR